MDYVPQYSVFRNLYGRVASKTNMVHENMAHDYHDSTHVLAHVHIQKMRDGAPVSGDCAIVSCTAINLRNYDRWSS